MKGLGGLLMLAMDCAMTAPTRAVDKVILDAPENACWDPGSRSWRPWRDVRDELLRELAGRKRFPGS